jgi:hypothetical protein
MKTPRSPIEAGKRRRLETIGVHEAPPVGCRTTNQSCRTTLEPLQEAPERTLSEDSVLSTLYPRLAPLLYPSCFLGLLTFLRCLSVILRDTSHWALKRLEVKK